MLSVSLISVLADATAKGNPNGAWMQFAILIPLFGLMYFLLIRPQKKRQQQLQDMLKTLKAGDKVITNGGAIGTITKVTEQRVRVAFSDRVEVEFVRSAIAGVVTNDEKPEAALEPQK